MRSEGSIDLKPGLDVGVWGFTCIAADLAEILKHNDWKGRLDFYRSITISLSDLALTIDSVEIIDVELGELGVPLPDGAPTDQSIDPVNRELVAIEYKLAIADFRHRLRAPRGGLLTLGELNKKPIDSKTGKDGNGRDPRTNAQLVEACLKEMGFKIVTGDPGAGEAVYPKDKIAGTPMLMDLDWRAVNPSEELSRILKSLGYIICPTLRGGLKIQKPGIGDDPSFGNAKVLSNLPVGSIDRRPTKLLVTSAPNAIRETVDFVGMNYQLEYCFLDVTDGKWKRWKEIDYLKNLDPISEFQNWWPNLPPVQVGGKTFNIYRNLEAYAFKCIRLNPDMFPRDTRVFSYIDSAENTPQSLTVLAAIPSLDPKTQTWAPTVEMAQVPVAAMLDSGRVICCKELLMKIGGSGFSTKEPRKYLVPLDLMQVNVRLTWDGWNTATGGPQCFRIGIEGHAEEFYFTHEDDGLDGFAPDATIARPDLVLRKLNGDPQNYDELVESVTQIGFTHLPSKLVPRRIRIEGYHKVELSGRISRVRITQTPPMTEVDIDDFGSPKNGGFRAAAPPPTTSQERQQVGAPGSVPPFVQLSPGEGGGGDGAQLFYVKLATDGGGDGGLESKPSYTYVVRDSGDKVIGSNVVPSWQRVKGSHLPAESGIARYKSDGAVQLLYGDEVANTGECDV